MIKILQFSFEGLLILGGLVFVYVQLVRPLVTKKPVFPMFRKRPNLEAEMESVNEKFGDIAQQQALARAKKKLEAKSRVATVVKKTDSPQ